MPDVRRAGLYKQQSRWHWDQRLCIHPPSLCRATPVNNTAFGVGVELVLGTLTDSSTKESIAPVRWFGVAKK